MSEPAPEGAETVPGWQLHRLPRAAVLAARDARLPATWLGNYLELLEQAARGHRQDDPGQLASFRALGRQAAESAAALPALVDLYLSATWRAWPQLVAGETDPTTLRDAARSVMRTADDVVAELCAGYSGAQLAIAVAEEARRRELVDDLLSGSEPVAGLLARAGELGLQLAARHVVLAVRAERPLSDAEPRVRRLREGLLALLPAGLSALVGTRGGWLVAVLPGAVAGNDEFVDRVVARLRGELDRSPPLRWRGGLSRGRSGPGGVRSGWEEARRSVELADRLGHPEPLTSADDMLLYQVLVRDSDSMADLIRVTLGPLRAARGGPQPLLQTISAFAENGGNASATARALHLSVRAVSYRLDRVASLTGLDPTVPAELFRLHTAILGWRLLGWPDDTPMEG